jgi:hypothetical protein
MNIHLVGALLSSAVLGIAGVGTKGLACTASGPVEVGSDFDVTGPGGFKVKIGLTFKAEGKDPNRSWTATNSTKKPLSGCLRFKDSSGNYVGSPQDVSIPAGGSVQGPMPPGATEYEISDEPCEDEGSDDEGSGDAVVAGSGRKYEHFFQGSPLIPDPSGKRDVTYAFTVRTFSSRSAARMRDAILAHGLARPLPSIRGVDGVEVYFYSESVVDLANARLHLTFADDTPFSFLDVGLNGNPTYATIASAMHSPTANGWDAYRFSLPLSDFDYDPTSGAAWSNELDVVYGNAGRPEVYEFLGLLEYVSD